MSNVVAKDRTGPGGSMWVSIAGLALLSFLVGTALAEFGVFPYPQILKPAFQSMRFRFGGRDVDWTEYWRFMPCRTTATGVTRQTSAACPGLTLYVSSKTSGATLIDIAGREVHRWHLPFYSIWPEPEHVSEKVSEDAIFTTHAHLDSNGNLLLNYCASGVTPYGYGLAKLDKDSKLLWSYAGRVHHAFDVAPDGTIYALTHEYRPLTDADRPPQVTGDLILEDFVVAISPTGQELWKISLFDALRQSPEYQSAAMTYNGWDVLHANAVRVIPEDFARRNDFCRAGQLFVSFRSTDTLAVLDVEQRRIVWAKQGFWKLQHDPIILPEGRMMIFDNQGFSSHRSLHDEFQQDEISRVAEFDPTTNAMVWEYHGSPQAPFYSKYRGCQQVLPNGNVLITESDQGRIFEVTREKEIVWEYYNRQRHQFEGQECVWHIPFARRFAVDECPFLATAPAK